MGNSSDTGRTGAAGAGCGHRRPLRSLLATLAIVAAILLVFIFFAVRTDAFKKWTEDYLGKKTGLDMTVGEVRIGWIYSLVIRDIQTYSEDEDGGAGIWADEARIGLALPFYVKLLVKGGRLHMVRLEDGSWRPSYFGRIGEIGEPGDVGWLTDGIRNKGMIEIRRGSIQWSDSDGSPLASVDGLDFSMEPVVLKNGRKLYHCQFSTSDMLCGDGKRLQNAQREWLFTESNEMIELRNEEGIRPPPPRAARKPPVAEPEEAK